MTKSLVPRYFGATAAVEQKYGCIPCNTAMLFCCPCRPPQKPHCTRTGTMPSRCKLTIIINSYCFSYSLLLGLPVFQYFISFNPSPLNFFVFICHSILFPIFVKLLICPTCPSHLSIISIAHLMPFIGPICQLVLSIVCKFAIMLLVYYLDSNLLLLSLLLI